MFVGASWFSMLVLTVLSWWKLDSSEKLWWVLLFGGLFLCTASITFSPVLRLCWVSRILLLVFSMLVFLWSKAFADTDIELLLQFSNPSAVALKVQEFWALSFALVWSATLVVHDWLYPKTRFSWLGNCGVYR